jgi:hypothetical protein
MKKKCRWCKKEFEAKSYMRKYCDSCKKKRDKDYQEFQNMEINDSNLEDA